MADRPLVNPTIIRPSVPATQPERWEVSCCPTFADSPNVPASGVGGHLTFDTEDAAVSALAAHLDDEHRIRPRTVVVIDAVPSADPAYRYKATSYRLVPVPWIVPDSLPTPEPTP